MMCLGITASLSRSGHDVEEQCDSFCGDVFKDQAFLSPPRDIDVLRQKSSANSTLYEINQPSFDGQCAICIGKQCFVLQKKTGMSKIKVPDYCVINCTIIFLTETACQ